jgi:hypothetical protein
VKVCVSVDERSWNKQTEERDRERPEQSARARLDRDKLAQPIRPTPTEDEAEEPDTLEPKDGPLVVPIGPVPEEALDEEPAGEGPGLLKRDKRTASVPEPPNPHEVDPKLHLKRLIEYEVTHEEGFEAVQTGCDHTLIVELYPLEDGWTVFGRYSGHAREETVEQVQADEFTALAERMTRALLRDQDIDATITRRNVLRADSEGKLERIGVQGHTLFALGTSLRLAWLGTAAGFDQPARRQLRLLTPVSAQLGYRGKFRAWGIDAFSRFHVGTRESSVRENDLGGHTDYDGGAGLGLHFLRFTRPDGMTSLYFGGGASFEVLVFSIIRQPERRGQDRDNLVAGGLDVSGLIGYEFMRASALHFMAELEVHAPAYAVHIENRSGSINTYLPGATALIGAAF